MSGWVLPWSVVVGVLGGACSGVVVLGVWWRGRRRRCGRFAGASLGRGGLLGGDGVGWSVHGAVLLMVFGYCVLG